MTERQGVKPSPSVTRSSGRDTVTKRRLATRMSGVPKFPRYREGLPASSSHITW